MSIFTMHREERVVSRRRFPPYLRGDDWNSEKMREENRANIT